MSQARSLPGIAILAAMLLPAAAVAGDLSITPVRVTITPNRPIATMTIRNAGAAATTIQMRVLAWSQKDGEDVLEPTQEVLANPGGFDLAPGGSQLARFGLRASSSAVEKSYRILIQEIPRAEAVIPGQVSTLLRISVPIFVDAAGVSPTLTWSLQRRSDKDLSLTATNTGAAHVQITRVTLIGAAGASVGAQPVSVYVLPGAYRRIDIRTTRSVAAGETLTLATETDGASSAATLRADGPASELASR